MKEMPKAIPFPTKPKQAPEETPEVPQMPEGTTIVPKEMTSSAAAGKAPKFTQLRQDTPEKSEEVETVPDPSAEKAEMPSDLNMENVVTINNKMYEIKPTKVKYFRNKAVSGYGFIKAIPLHEFFVYEKGVLDKNRDPDQLLYDFLVAAFDDPPFVRDNYNDMTAADVEQVVRIFGRINYIDEKEEAARKNREAQAAKR